MSQKVSFSRFVYLDTNILSMLVKKPEWCRPLPDVLYRHDLCIAVSGADVIELSETRHLHEDLNTLLTAIPSVLIKPHDKILDEEVRSYPNRRTDTLVLYRLNELLGKQAFAQFLSSPELDAARGQLPSAEQMRQILDALKPNFPPSKSGKYAREQAEEFAWGITVQWLTKTHRSWLRRFKDKGSVLKADVFLSVQLFGYALFYKYYLQGRQPKKRSNFVDMMHLATLPYCKLAILEKDMSNILNQIKSHHKVLDGVVVKDVDFFKKKEYLTWDEE